MKELRLQGFGPIGKGSINLSPLTILIGANGCVKSYTGMTLHSLLTSESGDRVFRARDKLSEFLDDNVCGSLTEKSEQLFEKNTVTIPEDHVNSVIEAYYDSIFSESFEESLRDTFATQLGELITVGRDKIVVELDTDFGRLKLGYYEGWDEFKAEKCPTFSGPIEVVSVDIDGPNDYQPITESETGYRFNIPGRAHRFEGESLAALIEGLAVCIEHVHFEYPFDNSYYLPAPRAGFLESHEILSAGAFNTLSRAGIEPIEVPAFSGAVSNYLSQVASISNADDMTELADLAQEFEEEVLGGEVKIEPAEQEPQPNITFKQYGQDFPFYLTSTGISEMAPLTLFTKYKLDEGSTVIIEEPEAHLHPENQRKAAEYITKLVNNGVRVVVTTHSDFFVEQLSNLVRLSAISKKKRQEADLEDLPPLSPNDISINMFYSKEGPEYMSESLEINQINGVPMDQFEKVGDELYGQAHKVDTLLQEELNSE